MRDATGLARAVRIHGCGSGIARIRLEPARRHRTADHPPAGDQLHHDRGEPADDGAGQSVADGERDCRQRVRAAAAMAAATKVLWACSMPFRMAV